MKLLLENWRTYLTESTQELNKIYDVFKKAHTRESPSRGHPMFKDHMYNHNSSVKSGRGMKDDPVAAHALDRRIKIPEDFYFEEVAGEEGTITEILYWTRQVYPMMGVYITWDNPQKVERNFRSGPNLLRVSDTTNNIRSMIEQGFEIK